MPTEQFKFNFEKDSSKSEVKSKVVSKEKVKKTPLRKKDNHGFARISEQERQDDQPRYGH